MVRGARSRQRGRSKASRVKGPTLAALVWAIGLGAIGGPAFGVDSERNEPLGWPEEQRRFWLDGPRLLLGDEAQRRVFDAPAEERQRLIDEALADPIPATEANELQAAVARRRSLVEAKLMTFLDDRARLLFLHGEPREVRPVDCDLTFKPLEIWTYDESLEKPRHLLLYQAKPDSAYRLWLPLDGKRDLYVEEMAYWLEQFHELRQFISGNRFDLQLCSMAKEIDQITGIRSLYEFRSGRPTNEELLVWLRPPTDLAAWSREALESPVAERPELEIEKVEVHYPSEEGQRIVSRITITLPAGENNLQSFQEGEGAPEYRLTIDGLIEHEAALFDDFRLRYVIGADPEASRLALVLDQPLRGDRSFYMRLRIRDEVRGADAVVALPLVVPAKPAPVPERPLGEGVMVALGDRLAEQRVPGKDDIVLVPPETEVVLGLWRADVLVTGERIQEVSFLVDGQVQMTRTRAPFSAEVRLDTYPKEQIIRVEGRDAAGQLVDADELVLNQQRGELRVRITSPPRGGQLSGEVEAAAEVVVPEERRLAKVEFWVNEQLLVTRESPPWHATVLVPELTSAQQVAYLTVVAELDNGTRSEDVRFLNVPDFMDAVEVDLVELYTTVIGADNRPVGDLVAGDFQVFEDGRRQEVARFELVEDLPLTLGITIDTSGSMLESLGEARRAASDFIQDISTPQDRAFLVSFADRAQVVMTRTSDMGAVTGALQELKANGMTALHDAIVTSLYYFRGVRGRRALVLLSDGEDTSSSIAFQEALEYARRSGVAIYAVGLNISRFDFDVRNKLAALARETGGRDFFISKADELRSVYAEIERELRSQYLLAFASDRPAAPDDTAFREVEVRVKGRLKARTISGYYP